MDPTALQDALYWYTADDAVRHAIEVASGLDSMVPGEPEILGQFKQASRDAEQAGALGGELHHLIQHTFAAAKKVRTLTEISRNPVSIAHVAVSLTQQFFDQLQERRALVIGAGEAARLVARYLNDAGIGHLTIANRSLSRAQKLARELLAHAIPMSHIDHAMEDADIVISSTASPVPVLGKGMVEDAVRRRKHRPIYMVDLAVPRDIEPQIARPLRRLPVHPGRFAPGHREEPAIPREAPGPGSQRDHRPAGGGVRATQRKSESAFALIRELPRPELSSCATRRWSRRNSG